MTPKTVLKLVARIVEAERRAAAAEEANRTLTRTLGAHHRVPANAPLPDNCQHCGAVLTRDFR